MINRLRVPTPGPSAVALLCAAVAVVAAFLTIVAAQGGWPDPTALVKMSHSEPLSDTARAVDPDFVFVEPQEHYDGVYYYAIASDPLLRGEAHTQIDQAAYRYGHPMHGWLARVVSLGHNAWIPAALMLLSLVGIGVAAWATSRLAVHFGRTPWGGLLIAASPGLLYAATVSTTECVAAALIAGVLLAWLRGRILLAGVLLVVLCLTKEQYVTVPLGLAVWDAVTARRARAWPTDLAARVAALVAGPAALALWYLYVHARLGMWPSTYEEGNLGAPFVGWLEAFERARDLAAGSFDASQIGTTSTPLLMAIAVVLVAAFVKALRLRTPLDAIVLGLVAITACMGWRTLLYPHELLRNPAIVLLLAIALLLIPSSPAQPSRSEVRADDETGATDGSDPTEETDPTEGTDAPDPGDGSGEPARAQRSMGSATGSATGA